MSPPPPRRTDTQTPAAANTAVAPAAAAPVRAAPTPAATAAAAAAAAAAEQSADEERPSAGGGATVQVQRPSATAATTSDGTYTVQAGDTLGDIAFRFGTTAAVLQDINQLDNPDLLQVGDVLILPGGEPEEEEDTVAEEDDGDEAATDETGEESDGEDGDDGDDATGDDATGDDATAEDATAEDEAGTDEAGEEGDDPAEDDPAEDDPAEDDAAEDAPAEDDTPPTPVPAAPTGLSPNGIPQPASDVTLEDVPVRPAALAAFATTALPWLQDRTAVDEIVDLFIAWSMPPIPRGDRFHLVDTDADGLFSLVAIFTDPGPAQHGSLTDANLVIYDPAPEQPTRWRQAFDHNLAYGGGQDFFVMTVVDLTGDGRRDIMYGETACGANTCTTIVRVLVRDGDGYRNAAVDIAVPTATSFGFDDVTGDGVADLTIEGGTFGSVGAGPVRPFQFVYSAVGGNFAEIARVGLPTSYLVWIIADGNTAFDAGDYVGALALYGLAASDGSLDEFVPGGRSGVDGAGAAARVDHAAPIGRRDGRHVAGADVVGGRRADRGAGDGLPERDHRAARTGHRLRGAERCARRRASRSGTRSGSSSASGCRPSCRSSYVPSKRPPGPRDGPPSPGLTARPDYAA